MAKFTEMGYEVVRNILSSDWKDALVAQLPTISNSGSRKLLDHQIFRETVQYIRNHPQLSKYLSELVAVQCTFFRKSKYHNWSISLHRDTLIPVQGEGEWHCAGLKEGINFVSPPRSFLDGCISVRVNLDDAFEGDLSVVPFSHLNTANPQRVEAKLIKVPCNAALVLRPTTVHGSSKLEKAEYRRVLHYLFAPLQLPSNYQWYHAV